MLVNFNDILLSVEIFNITSFKIFFQESHLSVNQLGSRLGWTFSHASSGFKLFAKVVSRQQKSPLGGKELNTRDDISSSARGLKSGLSLHLHSYFAVADPAGVRLSPHLCTLFLNILWKWNNLVSGRPNYFIFMGYLRKMRWNQQSEPPTPLNIWTPFPEILDPPLLWVCRQWRLWWAWAFAQAPLFRAFVAWQLAHVLAQISNYMFTITIFSFLKYLLNIDFYIPHIYPVGL